jgi:hypothetical protein
VHVRHEFYESSRTIFCPGALLRRPSTSMICCGMKVGRLRTARRRGCPRPRAVEEPRGHPAAPVAEEALLCSENNPGNPMRLFMHTFSLVRGPPEWRQDH